MTTQTGAVQMPPLPQPSHPTHVMGPLWNGNQMIDYAQAYAAQRVAEVEVKSCPGIPAAGCHYTATCNQICNKCGNVHHSHKLVKPSAVEPTAQPDGMLQDASRGLSKWLSNTPNARQEARNAATPPPVAGDVGTWLWIQLMDWCKQSGAAPASYGNLFKIVEAARIQFPTSNKEGV